MQTLQKKNASGVVTIPKQYLERDGVLDADGEFPNQQNLIVDRLGPKQYLVRLVDGGDVPEVHDCEVVRRIAAEMMLQQDALGRVHAD